MEEARFAPKMFKKQKIETRSFAYVHACAERVGGQPIDPKYPGYRKHQKVAYLLLLAITLEGLLNHVGGLVYSWWDAAERTLSTEAKLKIICDHCKISFNKGEPPIQTLLQLTRFRNDLVHPKTTMVTTEPINMLDERFGTTKWQQFSTRVDESRVKQDLDAFANKIWAYMGLDPGHKTPFGLLQHVYYDQT